MSRAAVPGYNLLRLLGRGGMGAVYLAEREEDGKPVALKVARTQLGEQGLARLRREAELLSRIQSPHLPAFVEARELREGFVLAMEFVRGDPLQVYVSEGGSPEERLEMLRRTLPGIAQGLLALHQAGIVHRDLKPANVIVNVRRTVLVDLGLARGPEVLTLTKTGVAVGTPEYLPPEQITGEPAEAPADLYQVGLIARDLLLGPRRKAGQDVIQDAMRRAIARPEDLRVQAPWIPIELAQWIRACLHPTPAGRPDPSAHLQKLVHLCKQPLPLAKAPPSVGTDEVTWLGSEEHAEVVAARREAEAKGWPAEAEVPSWMRGGAKSPAQAPRAPAPTPRTRGATLAVALVVATAAWLGARWTAPTSAASRRPELVLTLEGDRLIVLEGPRDLRLEGEGVGALSRDDSGRLQATVAPGASSFTVTSGSFPWEGRLPAYSGRLAEEIRQEGEALFLQSGVTPTGGKARIQWSGGQQELDPWTSEWIRLPRGALTSPTLSLHVVGGKSIRFEWEVDTAGMLEMAWAALPAFPEVSAREALLQKRFSSEVTQWLQKHGPVIRPMLESGMLPAGREQEIYDLLSAPVHVEWMFRRSPHSLEWDANRALGSSFQIGDQTSLERHPRRLTVGSPSSFPVELDIGVDEPPGGSFPHPELPQIALERVSPSTARVSIAGLRRDLPEAVEIGLHLSRLEGWTRVVVEFGGHVLRLPVGDDLAWRIHRVPPRWFRGAIRPSGDLDLDIRLDRGPGLEGSPRARVSRVWVWALYPKQE
jgi:predicted Ser/Thr protein kinase